MVYGACNSQTRPCSHLLCTHMTDRLVFTFTYSTVRVNYTLRQWVGGSEMDVQGVSQSGMRLTSFNSLTT